MCEITRERFDELIDLINKAELPSVHHVDDLPSDIYDVLDGNVVACGLEVDEHRWFETSTTVYRVGDWFIGLDGPSKLYGENSSWEDLCCPVVAFEMDQIQSVTYVEKPRKE